MGINKQSWKPLLITQKVICLSSFKSVSFLEFLDCAYSNGNGFHVNSWGGKIDMILFYHYRNYFKYNLLTQVFSQVK